MREIIITKLNDTLTIQYISLSKEKMILIPNLAEFIFLKSEWVIHIFLIDINKSRGIIIRVIGQEFYRKIIASDFYSSKEKNGKI